VEGQLKAMEGNIIKINRRRMFVGARIEGLKNINIIVG
jgi:hypothetical protein